ncbi:unnamed protein product [Leptidea sinapis]|uniref:BRISC and BRCA1-A complex member 1 n=1 Tax=Leptidea sinapis TaxID=189913 RepID=A0A5E4R2F6_9NEOP|nr:unnamed protein product [Leptidea sinapis]
MVRDARMDTPESLSPQDKELSLSRDSVANKKDYNYAELREKALENFQKPNLPNINIPERIVICLDVCYDDQNSLYRLGDGTTFTPTAMYKRVLNFFIYSKYAINKKTEFALIVLKNSEACLLQGFTNNIKDIIGKIDYVNGEESNTSSFDFKNILTIIRDEIEVPEYEQSKCMIPPPFIIRMLILYGRSNFVV